MSRKSPITIVPLKLVRTSFREVRIGRLGLETEHTYEQTPHQYMVDNTDILSSPKEVAPKYVGESRKTRWLTGWVHLDVLAKKYPEDEFIKRCLDPNRRYDEGSQYVIEEEAAKGFIIPKMEKTQILTRQEIVCFGGLIQGREVILVRVVPPAKIKYRLKGLRLEPYIAPA